MPNSDTYEEIKKVVADVYEFYDIKTVPINSFELAIKMGLTVIPYSALGEQKVNESMKYNTDGFSVETNENEWIIYYNDFEKNYARINQTIMHEIGHYVLGHTKDGEEEEAEAKFFAKYALVSPPLIHTLLEKKNINTVMDKFAINYTPARIALNNYRSWLDYGPRDYTLYEKRILTQLEIERY